MKRSEIIARRRAFAIPGYKTLADVGFDGEWVTPYQKISKSRTGPVLVAKDWLDAPSVDENRDTLWQLGYLPGIRFNQVMDLALEWAELTRKCIYVTQAFHLLTQERSQQIPRRDIYKSFDSITRYEVEGRTVIALGGDAQAACRRFKVDHIECIHPSARQSPDENAQELAAALLKAIEQIGTSRNLPTQTKKAYRIQKKAAKGGGFRQTPMTHGTHSGGKPKIVRILEDSPEGATIDELVKVMKSTEKQVRGQIDRARIPGGWNILNVGFRRFKLVEGTWRGA